MEELSQIEYLFPRQIDIAQWLHQSVDMPFSDEVVDFLNSLSQSLLHDTACRMYPDVVTFAFFCRRANMLKQKELFHSDKIRMGKGLVFHIAPSNVPVNFAYSLVTGLVAGNYNIVRVSSKPFPQVNIIVHHIEQTAAQYPDIAQRIMIVRYEHESNANEIFSALCNLRVIWGGDKTIATLRSYPIPSRTTEICFADRYSIAAIGADALLQENNLSALAEKFYNDTYLFDQNACTSPHLIVWIGDATTIQQAKDKFWTAVHGYVATHYHKFQEVIAVDKWTAMCRQAIGMDIYRVETQDNYILRVETENLTPDIEKYRCLGGYFTEYATQHIEDIAQIVNGRYQTLSYYGLERADLEQFVRLQRLSGIDRIVPVGETTAFSFVWDGYNLIDQMTRIVDVQ